MTPELFPRITFSELETLPCPVLVAVLPAIALATCVAVIARMKCVSDPVPRWIIFLIDPRRNPAPSPKPWGKQYGNCSAPDARNNPSTGMIAPTLRASTAYPPKPGKCGRASCRRMHPSGCGNGSASPSRPHYSLTQPTPRDRGVFSCKISIMWHNMPSYSLSPTGDSLDGRCAAPD